MTYRIFFRIVAAFLLFIMIALASCRKAEKVDSTPGLMLTFSTDTVSFDTVFTTVGSVTQRLMVYNPNPGKVIISTIRLAGGESSNFRINISGDPVIAASEVELAGNDSLFVFVRVTVNPNSANLPFVVSDSIEFTTNGTQQQVKLVAWGQNADFYKNAKITTNLIWDSLLAHVIYGSLSVENNATLTILPGTKVYFHQGGYLDIQKGSTLLVTGNLDHPISFQGDRLDPYYKELPGQWIGIFLEEGSIGNEINYAIIKNGTIGLAVDAPELATNNLLKLDNTIIQNMTSDGILAYGTSILSTNCVIGNCGGSAIDILAGGTYDFRQLTIGNYWSYSVRNIPSLYISNYSYDTLGNKVPGDLLKGYFGNAIVYGAEEEEIMYDTLPGALFNLNFDHSLLRTKLNTSDPIRYIDCIINKDPLFKDVQHFNYMPDSLSPVIGKGIPMGVPYDIKGIERGATPDLGAYQYKK